jgi:serine/threonine protein kinase
VYRYLGDDFLNLVRDGICIRARKEILKSSLQGLVDLHDRDVVHLGKYSFVSSEAKAHKHLGIKPDNIMADYHGEGESIVIEKVQLTDLENAGYLPKGRCIKGMLAGNDNWRSPEAHLKGELNKPADGFSFGIVVSLPLYFPTSLTSQCIYAILDHIIFGPDDDFKLHVSKGALPKMIRLQRQVSYFGDREGINGLMKHVGDQETNLRVLSLLWDDRYANYLPYKHFSEWPEVQD